MENRESMDFDAVIVGAGVAGSVCAIKLQRAGYKVLLVDRRKSITEYKTLCTHFIQPFSVPILHELGLSALLEPEQSVATKAAFLVPGGVIDPAGGYGGTEASQWAYNLERRVMDPALRQATLDSGVTLRMGTGLTAFDATPDGYQVTLTGHGQEYSVSCRQLVAADGRESRIARLLEAETQYYPNERAAYFCYCTGIPSPVDQRSLFSLKNNEMSFLYPLIEGRTLLSVYIQKSRAEEWGLSGSSFDMLKQLFESHLPHMDFSQASLDSRIFHYSKYENQVRRPVQMTIPFIGDASVSLDPMSGVGCGFAIKAADQLGDAIIQAGLQTSEQRQAAMQAYESAHEAFFSSHIKGIVADSLVSKSDQAVANTYEVILQDDKLQKRYIDLTGRLITPEQFQKSYLTSVAKQKSRARPAVV